jgi:hypothetical protein
VTRVPSGATLVTRVPSGVAAAAGSAAATSPPATSTAPAVILTVFLMLIPLVSVWNEHREPTTGG